ncbi:hypothetical protein DOM21_13280 [Bacteriovorax stolpii]|uniref:hypothetical protein n=1 Tax=Bacteriovorax stolpii TaxID=960 RepID=UPI001157C4C5|nr:hypothetical protein [Bacteriovorax stolpii]QDK42399.1 hypothetical protein DOM21_13280 [Bacteriovorax stolpii]
MSEVSSNEELKNIGRGRKKKENTREENHVEDHQYKFFVDLRHEKEVLEQILKMLKEANNKPYGKEINFRDLAVYAVPKLTIKDIEKIQEGSLTEMERVQRLLDEYNEKNKTSLSLGEFLVKKLNI